MTKSRVPPEKRVRVAQACARCKRRKEKCDGLTPCRNCGKAGVLCMTTTQAQLHGAVGDVRTSEPPPAKKQRTASLDRDPFSGLFREHYANYELSSDIKLSPGVGLPSPISPTADGRGIYGSPKSNASPRTSPSRKSLQRTCPHSRTTTEQMANCLRGILLESEGIQAPPTRACCKKMGSGSHSDRPEVRMPTLDEMTNLLSVFRTHVASVLDPILDTHFVDLVKVPSFGNHPTNRHCLSELILGISYQCVGRSTLSVKRRFSTMTTEAACSRAAAHFKTAQAGFDMAAAMENPDISSVQVILLMGIYRFFEGSEVAAASLTGLAVSMAQSLGISEQDQLSVDNKPNELYAGIWNSICNFDRVLALSSTRVCLIPHDNIALAPTLASSEISSILGKILQMTHRPESNPEILQPLSNELKSFITNLPVEYRWSTILSTSMPQQELIKSLHINALYFCAIFRLTKTSLLKTLKRTVQGASAQLDHFSLAFMNNIDSVNYNTLTNTYESRWAEAGIYSAQTSLRIFEKAKQNGVSIHGEPLLETWLTLSFLIYIAGIFTIPANSHQAINMVCGASRTPGGSTNDIESRLSQLSHLYQGLIAHAKMSPRLCSLSTFINDLRGHLSRRRSQDVTCGKDSFEALFGSLGDTMVTNAGLADTPIALNDMATMDTVLDEAVLTPESMNRRDSVSTVNHTQIEFSGSETGTMDISETDPDASLAALFPGTPSSMHGVALEGSLVGEENTASGSNLSESEQKTAVTEVDDLWQKIFEDLEPEDIEPEAGMKTHHSGSALGMDFALESDESMTAIERLIGQNREGVFA